MAAPAAPAALSWGDLLSRAVDQSAADESAATVERPSAGLWSDVAAEMNAQVSERPASRPQEPQPAPRTRVLPSLLPVAMPWPERKPGTQAEGAGSRSRTRSRLLSSDARQSRPPADDPHGGLPALVAGRPEPVQEPAPEPRAERTISPEQVRIAVQAHLRRLQRAGGAPAVDEDGRPATALSDKPQSPHRTGYCAVREPAKPVAAGAGSLTIEIDARPTGRRRREDFWKRRLRSYAGRL